MTITDADREALTDEIAEAISDSLDMDWQPKWATPAIIAIIERERIAAEQAGARKMQEAAAREAYDRLHPHPNHPESDWTDVAHLHSMAARSAREAIRALDPAQIAGGQT